MGTVENKVDSLLQIFTYKEKQMKNIMEKMKNTLLRAGLSEKEWEQIETEHFLSNRQNLLIYSKITFGFGVIFFQWCGE